MTNIRSGPICSLDIIMFSWCFVCIFLDIILLNVSVTGQQQHFRPFFDSRFTGHLLDFRLVIDTVLSILMSDVFLKAICKRRKSDPFSTSVCSDGGGYLTSDHWGTQCSLWCKNLRHLTNFSVWLEIWLSNELFLIYFRLQQLLLSWL